jgi:hypothetical protein
MKYIKYALSYVLSLFLTFVLTFVLFGVSIQSNLEKQSLEPFLDEQLINQVMNEMQKFVHEQNIDAFASYFTDDAEITMDMPASMGGETMVMNLPQYLEIVKQSWSMPVKYTHEVNDIVVKVAADKKSADVTDVTIETIKANGKLITSSKSYEEINFVMSDGKPKISSLYATIKMQYPY